MSSSFFFFLYSYSKELWDFITWFFSLKMVRCALCAKKRKGALKRCFFSFPFPIPKFSGGFSPDLWPSLATSLNSGALAFSIRFDNLSSATGKILWSTDRHLSSLCGRYVKHAEASGGGLPRGGRGYSHPGRAKRYLRLRVNTWFETNA